MRGMHPATRSSIVVGARPAAVWVAFGILLSGCGTLPSGDRWGENATPAPGWQRVRESAVDAARDPWVWAPLVAAAAFQIDDWDRRSADWAREHTPVFGSQSSARDWSDDLRKAAAIVHYATVLATPGGGDAGEWLANKAKGALIHSGAVAATGFATRRLKTSVDRRRPNDLGGESFPSGHTSSAAVHDRLASRNLQLIAAAGEWSASSRWAADAGLHALTIGTSWARIEAGWHYPADTLFSMALGHFVASFVNDAFLGLDERDLAVTIVPAADGAVVQFSVSLSR